jgi:serine/threonine-protein kinase
VELETRVNDLLECWEELRERGTPPSVEELCADCPELLEEVRRRIAALQAMDSALDTGKTRIPPTPADTGLGGATGKRRLPEALRARAVYRPQGYHAHGGVGEVLTARQVELDRLVALKRIRPDKLHETARRRFLREAEITAKLQHPGIVPIYGLGQDQDEPFYTMPFIRGQTLQAAIAAFHEDEALRRDSSRRSLKFRGLLQQFITACNTVAYAHDQGVVHRDLKPANIMLGPYGETLVLDWGLAKRIGGGEVAAESEGDGLSPSPSAEDLTATGRVLGTPRYMSPEQARGESAGPASDIFSLGLVLYDILTGKSAFEESSFRGEDRYKAVRAAAIVPPRSRDTRLPRGLEMICLKALAAQPGDRYPSARALADDLTSWLADEPVTAWREPLWLCARRWMRRHRTLVTSAAMLLVCSVVALAGFATVLTGKNRELSRQRQRAEEREALAIDAVKKFRDSVQANPELKNRPELDSLRQTLLKGPLEFFRQLRDQLQADRDTRPEALAELARASFDLAITTSEIGSIPDAFRWHAESLALFERLARANPAVSRYQIDLARSHTLIGKLQNEASHAAESLESFRHARAIHERLVRHDPTSARFQSALALSENNVGELLRRTGDPAAALESHQRALAIRQALVRDHPTSTEFRAGLAQTHLNLGLLLSEEGRSTEALAAYQRAVSFQDQVARADPAAAGAWGLLATIHNHIGVLLRETGDPAGALEAHRQALAIRERLAHENPTVFQYKAELAASHNNLGNLLSVTGQPAEALVEFRQAIALWERLVQDRPYVTELRSHQAIGHYNIGNLLSSLGKPAEALDSFHAGLEIQEHLVEENPEVPDYQSDLASLLNAVAEIDLGQGRCQEARERLVRAIRFQRAALAAMPRHPYYQEALRSDLINLAQVHRALNQPADAVGAAREVAVLAVGKANALYDAACALALCVPLLRGAQRQALVAEALGKLHEAIVAGWSDAARISREPDLVPLHDASEFQQLVRDLLDRTFPPDPFAP